MSIAELSRRTKTAIKRGITPQSLWAIEYGKTKSLKAETLFRIAAALDANPEWLRTGKGSPFSNGDTQDDKAVQAFLALPEDKRAMIAAAIFAVADK